MNKIFRRKKNYKKDGNIPSFLLYLDIYKYPSQRIV